MNRIEVHSSARPPQNVLDPRRIEFGKLCTPHIFLAEYRGGAWHHARIQDLQNFSLHPASTVFHYGQSVFEGLKAYRRQDEIALFRPEENARRFILSAKRLGMPPVDESLFLEAVETLIDLERDWVPSFPGSLYIRPTLIGVEPCLGVRSASEFLFFIITLPTGQYFKDLREGAGAIRVFVADHVSRAAPGGTGNVKASANYAMTLLTMTEAHTARCGQALFLDACAHEYVEEMGGMNIFFVKKDRLVTPPVHDTILPGITRDSIMRIAPSLKLCVEERRIRMSEVISGVESGEITEVLACGTAAVVAGISEFVWPNGHTLSVGAGTAGPVTNTLLEVLQGLQFGLTPDPFGWIKPVRRFAQVGP
jgi:branched-chain amino acid aminotransferase